MMDPAIDEPVAPRTPNKPLFPVTPDPLDARLAALEAVAAAAEAYLDDIECDPYDGTVLVPNETRIRAALAQLRALDEPTDTPVGGDDHA